MAYPALQDSPGVLDALRLLCSQPTVSGQTRALEDGVATVMSILRSNGLHCRLHATPGAPIVVGRFDAHLSRTLLVYGRYDLPAPGPRRGWHTDPFQAVIREQRLWARGAVAKAELVARAAAVGRLIEAGQMPFNVVFVVEGESLDGSSHLRDAAGPAASADWVLWSGGACDAGGVPLLYSGVKGLLQVELRAAGASIALPTSYASTAPNPLWSLVAALGSIKSSFEEVTIDGFYDDVAAPDKEALAEVRDLDVGEAQRRAAWGVQRFVANLKGPMLARAESFSPSCNLSAIDFVGNGDTIPSRARATLQFQLVPDQRPEHVFEQLVAHLDSYSGPAVSAVRLPGDYAPRAATGRSLAAVAAKAARPVYSGRPRLIGLAPFAAPASLLAPPGVPLISCGLERPDSALLGPDESVRLDDFEAHLRYVYELILAAA